MKKEIKTIDATPSKRIFLSIISDYDLTLGLCELIDNAIDSWIYRNKQDSLEVNILLDYQQQKIRVEDNSGGIPESEMKLIVSPGESRSDEQSETIGLFGVGSKRAVIALAQKISIYSRYKNNHTTLVELDDDWIEDPEWDIMIYKASDIPPSTTKIELSNLRDSINESEERRIIDHLGYTYALFLKQENFSIKINSKEVKPLLFQSWSYPKNYHPRKYSGNIELDETNKVKFEIIAGLTRKGDPANSEYGVYFYCNNRLISKSNKSYIFGYRNGKAGNPHPAISLARTIVKLEGKSQLMPWNSSKSEVNAKHKIFKELVPHIEDIVSNYSRASRSFQNDWQKNVFKYTKGQVEEIKIETLNSNSNLYLVPIPRKRNLKYSDYIKKINKEISQNKPWTKGSYEAIIAVDEISKLKLDQKNRINLIVLDSTLEIAFKDFLMNEVDEAFSEDRLSRIMRNRHEVHDVVKSKINFKSGTWERIIYYYNLRCDLIHKKVAASVSDTDIENFRKLVEYVLKKMFKLKFN